MSNYYDEFLKPSRLVYFYFFSLYFTKDEMKMYTIDNILIAMNERILFKKSIGAKRNFEYPWNLIWVQIISLYPCSKIMQCARGTNQKLALLYCDYYEVNYFWFLNTFHEYEHKFQPRDKGS